MSDSSDPAGDLVEIKADTVRDWTRTLDRLVERIERSEALGRELVEQRALNLDLQRQIHRLESQIRAFREGVASQAAAEAAAPQRRGGGSLIEKLFGGHRGSRMPSA